jgi:hypothetical protein
MAAPTCDIPEDVRIFAIALRLQRQQATLVQALCRNTLLSLEELTAMFGSMLNAKAAIHKTRKRLTEFNISIESSRGVGYWLTPRDKALVLDHLKPYMGG